MVPGPWRLATTFLVFALFGSVLAFVESPCEDKLFCFRRSVQRDERLSSRRISISDPRESREDFQRRENRNELRRFNIENVWREDRTLVGREDRRDALFPSKLESNREETRRIHLSERESRDLNRNDVLGRRDRIERIDERRDSRDARRVRIDREENTDRRIDDQDRQSEIDVDRNGRFVAERDETIRAQRSSISIRREELRERQDQRRTNMNNHRRGRDFEPRMQRHASRAEIDRLRIQDRQEFASRRIEIAQKNSGQITARRDANEQERRIDSRRAIQEGRLSRSRNEVQSEDRRTVERLMDTRKESANVRDGHENEQTRYNTRERAVNNRRVAREEESRLVERRSRDIRNRETAAERQDGRIEVYRNDRSNSYDPIDVRRVTQERRDSNGGVRSRQNNRQRTEFTKGLDSLRQDSAEGRFYVDRRDREASDRRDMRRQQDPRRETEIRDRIIRNRMELRQNAQREMEPSQEFTASRRVMTNRMESRDNIYAPEISRRQDQGERDEIRLSRDHERRISERQNSGERSQENNREGKNRDVNKQRESRIRVDAGRRYEDESRDSRQRASSQRENSERRQVTRDDLQRDSRQEVREKFEQAPARFERSISRRDSRDQNEDERRLNKDERGRISSRRIYNRESRNTEEFDRRNANDARDNRESREQIRNERRSNELRSIALSRRENEERNTLDRRESMESRRESKNRLVERNYRQEIREDTEDFRNSRDTRRTRSEENVRVNRRERIEIREPVTLRQTRRELSTRDEIRMDNDGLVRAERLNRRTEEYERISKREVRFNDARSSMDKNRERIVFEPNLNTVRSNRMTTDYDNNSFNRVKSFAADHGAYFYLLQAILLASVVASIIKQGETANEKKIRNNWFFSKLATLQPVF